MALTTPTNDLTGNTIASTYDQILFIDGTALTNSALFAVACQDGETALHVANDQILIKDSSGTDIASLFEVQDKDANVILSINGTNNRVGIGTASPGTDLHIDGTATTLKISSTTYGIITINTDSNDDGSSDDGVFQITNSSSGTVKGELRWDESDAALELSAADQGDHLCIKADGNVGIGTSSPGANLDIATSIDDPVILRLHSDTGGSAGTDGNCLIQFRNASTNKGAIGWDESSNTVILNHGTGVDNATPAIAIDTNNNVGIGTTAPIMSGFSTGSTKLDLYEPAANTRAILSIGGTGTTNGTILGSYYVVNNDNADATNHDADGKTISSIETALITSDSNAGDDSGGEIRIFTKPEAGTIARAITIDSSQNVGIGETSPTAKIHIVADTDAERAVNIIEADSGCDSNNIMMNLDYSGDNDIDDAVFIYFQDQGGNIGEISGNLNTTTYATSSDYRLKTDYKDIVDATGTINQLKLYDFAWKKNSSKRSMGVIAHEAQEIVPTAITGVKDAMTTKEYIDDHGDRQTKDVIKAQQADYSKFVPLLLKSVQELSAKVTALENA